MNPGTRLAGFFKSTTIHCYTRNTSMEALGLLVSEKIFYVFPIISIWELSFTMKTIVLISPGPNIPSDTTCKI